MPNPTLFVTYAHLDNEDADVEFIRQSIGSELNVVLDYVLLVPGQPIWSHLEKAIAECDAWAMVVSTNSLVSRACREELAWAFNRVMQAKGEFPLIGLVKGSVKTDELPSALQVRVWISLNDAEWKNKLVAAAHGRVPLPVTGIVKPYKAAWHVLGKDAHGVALEIRPRLVPWNEVYVEIPRPSLHEDEPYSAVGDPGQLPSTPQKLIRRDSSADDSFKLYVKGRIDDTRSLYIFVPYQPSLVRFGTTEKLEYEERPL